MAMLKCDWEHEDLVSCDEKDAALYIKKEGGELALCNKHANEGRQLLRLDASGTLRIIPDKGELYEAYGRWQTARDSFVQTFDDSEELTCLGYAIPSSCSGLVAVYYCTNGEPAPLCAKHLKNCDAVAYRGGVPMSRQYETEVDDIKPRDLLYRVLWNMHCQK
jgi:hypothetical protein